MNNSSYTIGDRTCDLPVCSAVPQPTAPPRTPYLCSTRFKSRSVIAFSRSLSRPRNNALVYAATAFFSIFPVHHHYRTTSLGAALSLQLKYRCYIKANFACLRHNGVLGEGGKIIALFTLLLDRSKLSAIFPQEKGHRTH
jgi:hypothetical protein